jgi:hypothetical protein
LPGETVTIGLNKGDRVRVVISSPGIGHIPKVGDRGTVEIQREDETVVVKLDDGRRALLASWEVELLDGE